MRDTICVSVSYGSFWFLSLTASELLLFCCSLSIGYTLLYIFLKMAFRHTYMETRLSKEFIIDAIFSSLAYTEANGEILKRRKWVGRDNGKGLECLWSLNCYHFLLLLTNTPSTSSSNTISRNLLVVRCRRPHDSKPYRVTLHTKELTRFSSFSIQHIWMLVGNLFPELF